MEEVAAVAHILTQTGIISAIEEQVQFARARFGTYDTIDFVIVLLSYALSGEPTLKAFYERLAPFRDDVAALFHRHHLPSRSALSRFLAALDEEAVEALRAQFLSDLLERATPFPALAACGIVAISSTCWWMWMEPDKPLANVLFLTSQRCQSRSVVWLRWLSLATQAANAEKWFGRAPRSCKRIPINGSAPSGNQAMGICVQGSSVLASSQLPMRASLSFKPTRSCSA